MPFPARSAPAPAPAPAAHQAPPAPAAPAPPAAPGAPPAPPTPTAPPAPAERLFFAFLNGVTTPLKPESEIRLLPPATLIMSQDQSSGWVAASTLVAPAPAAAGGMGRGAFHAPARPGAAPAGASAPQAGVGAPRGLFAAVAGAEVIRRGSYIMQGDYVGRLCSAEYKPGHSGNFVILEVEIVESTYDPAKTDTLECNQIGSRVSIFIKQNDSFASNIKEIIIALSGFDPQGKPRDVHDVVSAEECEAMISAAQPFTGAFVYMEARDAGHDQEGGHLHPHQLVADADEAGSGRPQQAGGRHGTVDSGGIR